MREIIFKGKRTDNGKWVKGLLARYNPKYEIANMVTDFDVLVPVYTETVGQFTGLTDMNGNKIFEGDILKRKHKELVNHSQKMTVNYIPYKACFSAVDIGGGNVTFISDYINNKYELEVIGNIHDNPELLEVQK